MKAIIVYISVTNSKENVAFVVPGFVAEKVGQMLRTDVMDRLEEMGITNVQLNQV